MLWQISMLNQLQCNSLVKDKNPTLSNGSDLNNSVKVLHQDSSTMRFHTQHGSDIMDILTTQKKIFIHSLRLIKNNKLTSVSIPLPQKEELHSRLNLMLSLTSLQKFSKN